MIRILEKGSYELNLEWLLEREEIIMSAKEDGRYLVHLPSVFGKRALRYFEWVYSTSA